MNWAGRIYPCDTAATRNSLRRRFLGRYRSDMTPEELAERITQARDRDAASQRQRHAGRVTRPKR